MKVVAVVGVVGGVGATALVANLSQAAVVQGSPVLAFDFSSSNMLRLYFGMNWDDRTGLAPQILAGRSWYEAAYYVPNGVDFVPFGASDDPALGERLASWLDDRPGWFAAQIAALDMPQNALLIVDCAAAPTAIMRQVLPAADLVLVAARADPNSYARVHDVLQLTCKMTSAETSTVLCQFDASRQLDRDIAVLLRSDPRFALAPVTLHQDEYLREALAHKQTVLGYSPASQAANDFRALCTWVVARLGHRQELVA